MHGTRLCTLLGALQQGAPLDVCLLGRHADGLARPLHVAAGDIWTDTGLAGYRGGGALLPSPWPRLAAGIMGLGLLSGIICSHLVRSA